jgi:putative phosphoribosyl transferase
MSAIAEAVTREVRIRAGPAVLVGTLAVPDTAAGIVLFAHGSGSGRLSPRNAYVARQLQRAGLGTLLFDLLTSEEERRDLATSEHRFDIPLLARRLVDATGWVLSQDESSNRPIGYFGASTGSAAALLAAAKLGTQIAAVVSRGGRPDLAGETALAQVRAATLLIVGGHDDVVIELNRDAFAHLGGPKDLAIVPGASHLFEEPGTLEEVARLASRWFASHLGMRPE